MEKILLVDDERDILDELAEALNDDGYETICAERVDTALEILRTHIDIKLVVTDLKMPGKSGADLIKQAGLEFERDISFIVISGSPESFGLDLSQLIYLRKPLDINHFLEIVEAKLAQL